jgi:hypothetical protein
MTYAFVCLVLKMADERLAMYGGFRDTSKHSAEWVQITKEFLKLAFVGAHC